MSFPSSVVDSLSVIGDSDSESMAKMRYSFSKAFRFSIGEKQLELNKHLAGLEDKIATTQW